MTDAVTLRAELMYNGGDVSCCSGRQDTGAEGRRRSIMRSSQVSPVQGVCVCVCVCVSKPKTLDGGSQEEERFSAIPYNAVYYSNNNNNTAFIQRLKSPVKDTEALVALG